jgi:hypothetical protein
MTKANFEEFFSNLLEKTVVANDDFHDDDHEKFLNSFSIEGKPQRLVIDVVEDESRIPKLKFGFLEIQEPSNSLQN